MKTIHTEKAPTAIGPYSQGIITGGFVFLSGQIGIDPATNSFVPGGIENQTMRVFENIGLLLHEAGCGFGDVVKCTVFLNDIGDFARVNSIYERYFTPPYPARSAFQAAALPKGALVEIEVIAAKPD